MMTKFVIKIFYSNGTKEYFQGSSQIGDIFTSNIHLAHLFDEYEEAENRIWAMDGLFQIEKIYIV